MVRPKTKKEKEGTETYHGKHKNARGGGSRGGRGDSGKCKHTSCVLCFSELRWASMVSSGSLFAKSSK